MPQSLRPHGLQHTRLLCPSPSPGACSKACPLSWWCHPTISSTVVPFSCLQSFPASGSFPISQLFASGKASLLHHFSFSMSPSNEYSGLISFRKDCFDLLAVQGTLQHHSSKVSTILHSAFFMVQLTSVHDYWKNNSFDYMDFCWQSNISALNILSVFVIAFPPRSKCLNFKLQ